MASNISKPAGCALQLMAIGLGFVALFAWPNDHEVIAVLSLVGAVALLLLGRRPVTRRGDDS